MPLRSPRGLLLVALERPSLGSGTGSRQARFALSHPFRLVQFWLGRSKARGWKSGEHSPDSDCLQINAHMQFLPEGCALYGWEIDEMIRDVRPAAWPCRVCAGLSYASEAGALITRRLLPQLKPFSRLLCRPNPGRWEPLVFASPRAALDAGLCRSNL